MKNEFHFSPYCHSLNGNYRCGKWRNCWCDKRSALLAQ